MRKKRRRPVEHVSHDRWLVSYADFVTLLFAFFVVLYASSQVDKRKVGNLALAIQVAFQQMGVFDTSNTKIPLSDSEAVPFTQVQVVENAERTGDFRRFVQPMKGILNPLTEQPLKDIEEALMKALAPENPKARGHRDRSSGRHCGELARNWILRKRFCNHSRVFAGRYRPPRRHSAIARRGPAHRRSHRQRPNPQQIFRFQLGAFHRALLAARQDVHRSLQLYSHAPFRRRLRAIPSCRPQRHRRRPCPQSSRRHRHPQSLAAFQLTLN